MAKDPAVLWYWNDWHGGTVTFSRHLKGCYMDLLYAQFNNGHLSLEEIRTVLGTDFAAWGTLSKKFAQDATGKFFNERMEQLIAERKAYSEKQKDRVKKRWNKPPSGNTVVLPQREDEVENEIENKNQGGAGGIPSQAQIEGIFKESGLTTEQGEEFYLWVSGAKGWDKVPHWLNYTMATVKRKLNEKHFKHGNRDKRREPAGHQEGFGNL